MEIGIFAKTFERKGAAATLRAVRSCGLRAAQFNMTCAGLPSMPEAIPEEVAAGIGASAREQGVDLVAVSGTFNMIHPDPQVRREGLARLRVLAAACAPMGTPVITLCTGTRDPRDKWQRHPANSAPEAWQDLLASMEQALQVAEDCGVTLAFEPEHANVVDTAAKGQRLLEAMRSPRLKVVFDPANLFEVAPPQERRRLVAEGLDTLGEHVVIAHAKDRRADGSFCAAGRGVLDYEHYLETLQSACPDAPLVLHGLEERDVAPCVRFLRKRLRPR